MWLYILYCVLSTLDVIGSYFLLSPDCEGNPIMKLIWENYGYTTVILVKTAIVMLVLFIYEYLMSREKTGYGGFVIWFAVVVTTTPVLLLLYIWIMMHLC